MLPSVVDCQRAMVDKEGKGKSKENMPLSKRHHMSLSLKKKEETLSTVCRFAFVSIKEAFKEILPASTAKNNTLALKKFTE